MEPEPAPVEAAPAPAPAEPAPVLEHDVVIQEGEHTAYPAPLASHEKVLQDKGLFLALCEDLCTKLQDAEPRQWRPTKFRVPTAAGQDLDLQRLYRCTTELGGAVAVTEQQRWPEVIKPMNFPSKVNTAAIRKIYSQLLWHFEQVYCNGAAGQPLSEPPELAAATAAAAAVQAAAAERHGGSAAADGRARPARSRKGPSLAALIAAEDQFGSGFEESVADDHEGSEDGGSADEDDPAAGPGPGAGGEPAKKPSAAVAGFAAAAAAPLAAGSPSRGSAPPAAAAAAAANGPAPAKPRSRPQPQQQRSGSVLAPGKTPELTAFLKSGRPRRDLTGAPVSGRVEARFDCGYFVSLTVGGLQFGGVLYCPTGTGSSGAGQAGSRANVKREEGAADGANGVARKPPAAGSVKREAGAAGFEEGGGGGGGSRSAKRRRSARDANDPTLANKPKSAKTAFNFFAAEQWASLRGELGVNAAPQDISRLIGERWNKTAEEERAPYVAMAQEDKGRYEREMESWRGGLAGVAAAAATPADSAAADGDGDGAAGSPAPGDGDAAAGVAVKQEQRSATPPKSHHPKIKLKMRQQTPPPAAAAAAEAADGAAAGAEAGVQQQQQQQQQQFQQQVLQPGASSAGYAAEGPPASPTLPAAEPMLLPPQHQQQHHDPVLAAAAAGGPMGLAYPVLGPGAVGDMMGAVPAPAAAAEMPDPGAGAAGGGVADMEQ